MTLIWDGIDFRQVTLEEAQKLVNEDKAQILPAVVDGAALRWRKQFTGYQDRMVTTEKPKKERKTKPAPKPDPEPVAEAIPANPFERFTDPEPTPEVEPAVSPPKPSKRERIARYLSKNVADVTDEDVSQYGKVFKD